MCGIAGSLRFPLPLNVLEESLRHRGPDGNGFWEHEDIQLWHSRLAIIDAAGGSQPMNIGHLTITFNGEIYNYSKLKQEYRLDCNTHSDTEVLLALVHEYGLEKLSELDGMFAGAIHDSKTNKLHLFRDRLGEKPLYLWRSDDRIVFCSELATLRSVVSTEVNVEYVNDYLATGLHTGEETALTNVYEIPAGQHWTLSTETDVIDKSVWFEHTLFEPDLNRLRNNKPIKQPSVDALTQELERALDSTIKQQLDASDLEVGTFLSGGIDSGLVTAIASQHTKRLKTFTVSFEGQFDESAQAKLVSDRYDTDHHELHIDYEDLPNNIEKIIRNYGEPMCDDSIIPSWYISREAKKHVTVILTGDGADELFGGYRRYVPYRHRDLFKTRSRLDSFLSASKHALPSFKTKLTSYSFLWRLLDILGEEGLDRYLASTTGMNRDHLTRKPDLVNLKKTYEIVSNTRGLTSLQKIQQLDSQFLLTGTYLPKVDIASMAHSLESRCPFLGKEVLTVVSRVPDEYKINKLTTKSILRNLGSRWLPEQTVSAPKRGFETPLQVWLRGPLKDLVNQHLTPDTAPILEFVEKHEIERLLKESNGSISVLDAKKLWTLFSSNVWMTG